MGKWLGTLLILLVLATGVHAQVLPSRGGGGGNIIGQVSSCSAGAPFIKFSAGVWACAADPGAGTGAPTSATYWVATADGTLSAEIAMGALATGLVLNTTTTGIPTIYAGSGAVSNQFLRSVNASGVGTHSAILETDISTGLITSTHILDGTILNADVNASAAIVESKLALNFATHANTNDPTANEKAALDGADTGGAPTSGNKYVVNDDVRLPAMQTPAALSAASVIMCTNQTQLITGSGGAVTLTNAAWLANGTANGQECELQNSSTTNTITVPTTATIIHCGGVGSVVIGKNHATPRYKWTGSLWQQQGCMNIQQALNSGAKLLAGLTTAAPLQLRGGTVDAPSTTGFDLYDDGSGNPVLKGISGGVDADSVMVASAGKLGKFLSGADELARITESLDSWDFLAGHLHLRGGTGAPTAGDCDASGEARRVWVQTDAADVSRMIWLCRGSAGWSQQGSPDIGLRIGATSVTAVPDNTPTGVAFNTEVCTGCYDTDNMHNSVTNNTRITFTTAGKYLVQCRVRLTADTNGTVRTAQIRKNGTTDIGEDRLPAGSTFTESPFLKASVIYNFIANDYVELIITQNSGVGLDSLVTGERYPYCEAQRVN